uniref:Zinc binding dehydrogenase n=1 Tax=Solanum tuberosum TaxID=4113 RepID=M1CDL9_SOLTU
MATARIVSLKALVHGVSVSRWTPLSRVLRLRSRPLYSAVRDYSAAISPPSKAVVYDQHGSPDVVTRVTELPPVEINDNDVCVRMLAAPINPSDINRIEGVYPVRPPLPAVGGYEGVGEVHAIGSAVKGLSPGDWVIPSPPSSGTWQTYVVKEQSVWQKVDKSTPMEYAATVIVNPLTALRMLEDFIALKSGFPNFESDVYCLLPSPLLMFFISRGHYCAKWCYKHSGAMCYSTSSTSWDS